MRSWATRTSRTPCEHLTPLPRDEVIGLGLGAEHVERNRCELQRGTTLYKDNLVLGGYIQDVTEILLGFVRDRNKLLRTVRHLHDAHAAAPVIEHLALHRLQNLQRHLTGSRGEIVHTSLRHCKNRTRSPNTIENWTKA